ncbi:MAG: YheU family protein [Colwellia sp.]|nr:YheU family protein [Colwellia sp.]
MIIPIKELSTEVLDTIVKEFVLREGTEYGDHDVELSDKISQVKNQLNQGSAVLVYSELHETVNILPKDQFEQQQSEQ